MTDTDRIISQIPLPTPSRNGPAYSVGNENFPDIAGFNEGISIASCLDRGGCRTGGGNTGSYGSGAGNTTMRAPFTQAAYDAMRPHNALPTNHHDLMIEVEKIYKEEGIIRNTIDLMTDFCCAGIKLNHPNKYHQKLYRNWFARIGGLDRSERFLNSFYKFGTVIIMRHWGSLTKKQRKDLRTAQAKDVELEVIETKKYRVPTKYTFLNPAYVRAIDGEKNIAAGKELRYEMFIPQLYNDQFNIFDIIDPEDRDEEYLLVPGEKTRRIDNENVQVFNFKKEDWEVWGTPIMYSILRDVYQLQMNRIADFTALETAASPVRIWKLGNLEYKLVPNEAAFARLQIALSANPGAGMRELVWGPDIQLLESSNDKSPILGEEKYKPCLNAIYVGLGIPPTLTGSAIAGGGTTNNLISLKTLVKRLVYGRNKLVEFWNNEIEIFRKAMGFAKPAEIDFDDVNLGDEEAEKKLWIDLADRNLISDEWLQCKFGAIPEIETSRLNRESKGRGKFNRVPKSGPWHDPEYLHKIERALLEAGRITPDQVGLVFPDPDPEEDNVEPLDDGSSAPDTVQTDQPAKKQAGRPSNSRDQVPRKRRRFIPRTKAQIWGSSAQQEISNIVNPLILTFYNKKNLRSLSDEEAEAAEKMRFNVLMSLEPFSEVTANSVKSGVSDFNTEAYTTFSEEILELQGSLGRALTMEEKRTIQLEVYLNGYF